MRTRMFLVIAVAVAMTVALTTSALAKRPDDAGKPAPNPIAAPSCQERVDGGAIWSLGAYDPDSDSYSATGVATCTDITEPQHLRTVLPNGDIEPATITWSVSVSGEVAKFKGLKLVFEQGVHGTVFAEIVVTPDTATIDPGNGQFVFQDTVTVTPTGEPLSFVAMPRNGDTWITPPTVTLKPTLGG